MVRDKLKCSAPPGDRVPPTSGPCTPRKQLAERLGALTLLYTTDDTRTLDSWTERASRSGHLFSLGDLMVGILASEVGALVWSLDSDFGRMEKLDLVRLHG
jgi:predicted nucleic acid-binding protein